MNVNITSTMSNPQMIAECHKVTAVTPLIILFFSFIFFFLLFGLIYVKKDRLKLLKILVWVVLFCGLILTVLLLLPNVTQLVVNFFVKLSV
jgi:hypothetical protein